MILPSGHTGRGAVEAAAADLPNAFPGLRNVSVNNIVLSFSPDFLGRQFHDFENRQTEYVECNKG